MREILFRGKTKNGNWIYGDLNFINGQVYIFDRSPEGSFDSADNSIVIPETVEIKTDDGKFKSIEIVKIL